MTLRYFIPNRVATTSRLKAEMPKVMLAILLICLASTAMATQLYRYKDANGKTVLERYIPPDAVPRGYDILNEKGRLIERVPPALTAEQIAERNAERARLAELERQRRAQEQKDKELLQVYGHPDAAVRILERRVKDIHRVLQVNKVQIGKTEKRILEAEEEAANMQRLGQNVSEDVLKRIENFKKDIDNYNSEIIELSKDRSQIMDEFKQTIQRLEFLTNSFSDSYVRVKAELGKEYATLTESVSTILAIEAQKAKQQSDSPKASTEKSEPKVALNASALQGKWVITKYASSAGTDSGQAREAWVFEEDQFYQISNGQRLSPDLFKVTSDTIDIGYTQIKIEQFNGKTMQAQFAGSTYQLRKN